MWILAKPRTGGEVWEHVLVNYQAGARHSAGLLFPESLYVHTTVLVWYHHFTKQEVKFREEIKPPRSQPTFKL